METAARSASRRDAWIALGALMALLLWEVSGLDLVLTRWIATPRGFAWRDSVLAGQVLHGGGRVLGWALLALLVWDAARPLGMWPPRSLPPEEAGPPLERPGGGPGPSRAERVRGIGVVIAGLVLVPMLKRFSATSCPWDLAEFGGRAAYVPHWSIGLSDGGPGHCFPSGHAVAAFAFFGVYFLWRHHRPRAARVVLLAVLGLGFAFGWAQWVRGAHFVSHTLWSAWLCWVIAALAAWCWPDRHPAAPQAGQPPRGAASVGAAS